MVGKWTLADEDAAQKVRCACGRVSMSSVMWTWLRSRGLGDHSPEGCHTKAAAPRATKE